MVSGLSGSSNVVLYPSFRNRNYWLEYSTPSTTTYSDDYDYPGQEDVSHIPSTTTPKPGPFFMEPHKNHTTKQSTVGYATFLSCHVGDLMDYQVSISHKLTNEIHQ